MGNKGNYEDEIKFKPNMVCSKPSEKCPISYPIYNFPCSTKRNWRKHAKS